MEPTKLSNIPTHLIAGPLGAGKTTLLQNLLRQRPEGERWAILINEFGQLGLDAALLAPDTRDGVSLAEIPGGCLCCVNGLPFQVGLQRLLRRSQPQRLLIETSGLGHPAALLQQLEAEPWTGVLAMQPMIMVLDAQAMSKGQALPDSQQAALPLAGCLLMNKSAHLTQRQRQQLAAQLPQVPWHWTEQAGIDWFRLPGSDSSLEPQPLARVNAANDISMGVLWRSRDEIHSHQQSQADRHSLSWRLHPQQALDLQQLERWLSRSPWLRAKAMVRLAAGWYSLNALPDHALAWNPAAEAREQRIELIFAELQDQEQLTTTLRQTLITG
ncbi:CobW family GTP-binding protein [Halopseudomonas salegens]|uniref:GTPase, G3E family n=1 Tax=Halopseudomonas salegens TaxID=1434072 RepID=A0A1H2HPL7_9GAMM|nr:CobW family GTP-binding protein [Halopseudomonas salegens]SDU33696.1 GTPase, G3E family [Halopseudomonas salegens]